MEQSGSIIIVQKDAEQGEYPIVEFLKTGGKVHRTMEDNAIRTGTETWEGNNGGAVKMQNNRDGRKCK